MAEDSKQASDKSLAQDLRALRTILGKTGRAWRRPIFFEGLLWYAVTLGAVVLSALLVGALVPSFVPVVTGWVLIIGAAAATVGAIVAWFGFVVGKDDVEQVAVLLQRHHHAFRNDLVAALEFAEALLDDDAGLDFSAPMARAHVRRTVRRVHEMCEHGHLAHLLPRRELVAPAMSLAGCLVLLIVPLLVDAGWSLEILRSPFANAKRVVAQHVGEQPIVGNLYIYYTNPAYTGLGRKVDAFSTGYVDTMVGTEVAIEAQSLIPNAKQIEMVIKTADGTQSVVMEPQDDGLRPTLRGSFVALKAGTYHFRATLADGTVVEDGTERKIKLEPDKKPSVTLTSQTGEVEVSPDDVLDVKFDVSDDFGLTSVSRVWYFAGDEKNADRQKLDLPELQNTPRETSGGFKFDLRPLGLHPKDVVILYVEAVDNNTMTGPGVGRSRPVVLRVASPEDKHLENIADQQKLLEQLLSLLADYLENPMGQRSVDKDDTWKQTVQVSTPPDQLMARFRKLQALQPRQEKIIAAMKALVGRLDDDPLMVQRDYTLFSALHQELAKLHKGGKKVMASAAEAADQKMLTIDRAQPVADYAGHAESVLERGLLRFEELLRSEKMEAIKATAKDIKELKERLKRLLEKYKKTKDPALKKAILRDVQRLRQRMNELLRRMRMQLQKLPKEHLNMDALKQKQLESKTYKMADSLQQIEKMLKQDDVDGALKALDNMETNLDSLTQDMDQQFAKAQPKGLSELDKKVSKLMDQANDVQQAEKQLEQDTAKLNKQMSEKRRQEVDKMLDQFTKKMLKKVDQQKKALDKMAQQANEQPHQDGIAETRRQLDKLEKMLKDKDIAQSLDRARKALQSSRRLRFRLDLSRRYSESNEQNKRLDQLEKANQGVEKRGQQMVDDLQKVMDQAQQKLGKMDQQRMQQLGQRQQRISKQAQKLGQKIGEASKRFPVLKQQLGPAMQKSQQAMDDAAGSLGKRHTQRALDSERQALDQLGKLKQKMRQAVQKQRRQQQQAGGQGVRQQKVKIPGKDNQRAGKQLRKDVMDAMKQEKLDGYQSEIKRYYKSIME